MIFNSTLTKYGTDTSKDTVTEKNLLKGVTAHDASGEQVTGTIPTFAGEETYTMRVDDAMVIPTAGAYCDNDLTIVPALQDKTVTENGEVSADEGYVGLRSVIVNSPNNADTSKDTVTAATLLKGVTAHDASGNLIVGTLEIPSIMIGYDEATGDLTIGGGAN